MVYLFTQYQLTTCLQKEKTKEALDFDLIVSIGGDGTFMKSAKYSTFYSLILPYPCGKRNAYYEQASQTLLNSRTCFKGRFLP